MLDSDNDGLISANKINIKALPIKILISFSSLFIRMEELDLELDKEMFLLASEKLLKVFFSIFDFNYYSRR